MSIYISNDQLEQILDLIREYPKHFSQKIKRDDELRDAIGYYDGANIAELAYNALYPNQNICFRGKQKKFKSFRDGYSYCGRASDCECAKKAVSESVKNSKSKISKDKQALINQKRSRTNLSKYGVSNVGQTHTSLERHRETYLNSSRVKEITSRIKETKEKRYGDSSYNNAEKIKKTWNEKKKQYFAEKFPEINYDLLNDKKQLSELYDQMTVEDMASELNVHIQTVYRYLNDYGLRSKYSSSLEKEMVNFLKENGVDNMTCNSRSIISKELDIFLPDYKVAIEMNGIYWHHDQIQHIGKNYHYEKFKECEQKGIHLITVFSDVWESKKETVKRMILSKLGLLSQKQVYARNCDIIDLKSSETRSFLTKNHIQGYTPASYCYGLKHKGNIVAVMTFSKPRAGIGKKRHDTAELVRYSTNCRVVGGAGKLLSHFLRNNQFSNIISYSDNEWSRGDLYVKLGFVLEKEHKPGYFYYCPKEKIRKHRYNFAKHRLVAQGFNPNMTEAEIQYERGFLRIWDCGKRVWVLTR